ncbi:MAG: exosome complex exonuclease Rrp41 [Candidatus Micrarchaeia archaeon]|jgi:exosome complex component RRP41
MQKPELVKDGKRLDGRDFEELRPLKIVAGIIKNATGSAYLEWGNNKVLAAVYGPKEVLPKHLADPEKAIVKCRYSMAPFSSLEEHGRAGPNRRATEISKVTKEVFENLIMLEKFPSTEIDIFIEILQSDGGTRSAGITAAGVALADSGIPIRDIPFAVAGGKIGDNLAIDFNKIEDNYSDADIPIAISPNLGRVLLLQMDGKMTKDEFSKYLDMVDRVSKQIISAQKNALLEKYKVNG